MFAQKSVHTLVRVKFVSAKVRGVIAPVVSVMLCLWATVACGDAAGVNAFYQKLIEIFQQDVAKVRRVGELVQSQRPTAVECLGVLKQKARSASGKTALVFDRVSERLEDALLLTKSGPDCTPATSDRLAKQIRKGLDAQDSSEDKTWSLDRDDRIFYLENMIRLCPESAKQFAGQLGDLYRGERQFGMAVAAYEKALSFRDDEDTRTLLADARDHLARYERGEGLSQTSMTDLIVKSVMAPAIGSVRRKADMVNAVQTNRVLFDEWSDRIKPESVPELTAMGEAMRSGFADLGTANVGVLIEGHSDKRGDFEKNLEVSKQRAEAVKAFFAHQFGIDPRRIITRGFGPTRPLSPREDDAGYALNRRVEFKKVDLSSSEAGQPR